MNAKARIDLTAIGHNLEIVRSRADGAMIMGVVKADAYGHGAVPVARYLQQQGVSHFAVATLEEGVELREGGLGGSILVFSPPFEEELPAFARHDLELNVASIETAKVVAASRLSLKGHIKVDTGMSRYGVSQEDVSKLRAILEPSLLEVVGVMTHLATADDDSDFARIQLARFDEIRQELPWKHAVPHASNSAGLLLHPDWSGEGGMVRAGISLYGYLNTPDHEASLGLKPAMSVTARVRQVRRVAPGTGVSYGSTWKAARSTRIAVVGFGYADGYPRALSNKGRVRIGDALYPVIGRVCMDAIMVDIGGNDGISEGTQVGIMGPSGPTASELATQADSIPYELCCRVSPRVHRVHTQG